MSTTSLNFHNVTEASARVQHAPGCDWLTLYFTDGNGANLEVTLFSTSPEELLQAIARAAAPDLADPIRECNACDWKGPLSETCMLGAVGPLCPKCRETTTEAS